MTRRSLSSSETGSAYTTVVASPSRRDGVGNALRAAFETQAAPSLPSDLADRLARLR